MKSVKIKSVFIVVLIGILYFSGIAAIVYPMISNVISLSTSRTAISDYVETVKQMPDETIAEKFSLADKYNADLAKGIYKDGLERSLCDKNGIWQTEGVTPIELTVDILENNFPTAELIGWYPCDDEKNGFHIDYCPEGIMPSGDYDEFTACVKYVHELQTLITIFKIDKQIVL